VQIVSHRINYLMLNSLLLWNNSLRISERACFVSVLFFSLNRSLWSFFDLIFVYRVIWWLLWWPIILIWFIHDHHVLIRTDPDHLVSISLDLLLISVCQVTRIVSLPSILLPILPHCRFIHKHYVTVRVIYIWEKVWAIWLKWYYLLVIEQGVFVKVRTIEALWLFIWYIISCCLGDWMAGTRIVWCMLVHKVVRLLVIFLAIVDICWTIF
jgi:hypothetical protein